MILPNFSKNCMKLKEFGLGGGRVPRAPLRSANGFRNAFTCSCLSRWGVCEVFVTETLPLLPRDPLVRNPPDREPPNRQRTPEQTEKPRTDREPLNRDLMAVTAAGGIHLTGIHSCSYLNYVRYTGRVRLIRSHSSARFCFELSGNSN